MTISGGVRSSPVIAGARSAKSHITAPIKAAAMQAILFS
jgi:hypothetical protein